MTKFEEIKQLLEDNAVKYELIEHKPANTSAEAEAATGWPLNSGAKSIVFKVGEKFVLAVVRGDKSVDFKKLRAHFGERQARLATPDEVEKVMGVPIGACYPFAEVAGIDGVIDENLDKVKKISFSPGTREHHIRIRKNDFVKITNAKFADITRE